MPVKHATEAHEGDVISCDIWNEEHSITNLLPDANATYKLGDASHRWVSAYIDQIFMINAASNAFNVYYSTSDLFARFKITASGRLEWGDGNSETDVNLYRSAANVLTTDDAFNCNSLQVGDTEVISSDRIVSNVNGVYIGSYSRTATALLKLMAEMNYSSKIMFREEGDAYAGADILYDGSANVLKIQTVDPGPNVIEALAVTRSDGKVDIKQGLKINGTEVLTSGRALQNLTGATLNLESTLVFKGSTEGTLGANIGFIEFKDTYLTGDRTLQLKGIYDGDGKYKFQWYYWDGSTWTQILEGPTQDGYVEFKGNVTLKSTGPVLKLENTSSSTAYPRLEFKNPKITYRCGMLFSDSSDFFFPYDSTHDLNRMKIYYNTATDSSQFRWYNSSGLSRMYLDYEGDLYIDGNYMTYSPELPKDWQETDFKNYLKTQLNKGHPPRDEKGRKICICGKPGVCPEHQTEFNERYAFDVSTTVATTAKLVISLMDKITQLENRITQLEEQLSQSTG